MEISRVDPYRNENIHIKLNGFENDPEFASFVKGLIDILHYEDAPSDASTTASFTKFEKLVTGAIQISSTQGVFSAKARGLQAHKVVHKVFHEIQSQLKTWKQNRWRKDHPAKSEFYPAP